MSPQASILKIFNESNRGVYLGFDTFGRLVFCEVRTHIVGKTKFFDSIDVSLFIATR